MKGKAPWEKRGLGDYIGHLLIAGVLLIVAVVSIAAYKYSSSRPSIDRATNCPTDAWPSVTAVLLDMTDPLSPVQGAAVLAALEVIRDDTPQYGRLEIYPLRPVTEAVIQPIYAGCSPGSAADVHSTIAGNRKLADREWKRRFADKVDEAVRSTTQLEPANQSPLMEGIQSVAVTAFASGHGRNAPVKKLVVISDLIHHTAQFSMYGGAPSYAAFQKIPYAAQVEPSLKGIDVELLMLVRVTRRNVQQPGLRSFWEAYVANARGRSVHWKTLQ